MKKTVNVTGIKDIFYIYRISSINIDKVTLEKHSVDLSNRTLEGRGVVNYEISDDTKVGTVTQKVTDNLIAAVTKMVDSAIIEFYIEDKKGISLMIAEGGKIIK